LWQPFVAGLRSKLVALAGRMLKKIRRA
jgi:hypothetical protein